MASQQESSALDRKALFLKNRIFLLGTLLFVVINLVYLAFSNQGDALVYINGLRNDFLDVLLRVGTKFAEPEAYLGVLIIVSAVNYRKGIFSALAGISAGLAAGLLKWLFAQPRPMRWFFDNHENIWHSLNQFEEQYRNWSENSSFPSGHATSAFALYGLLAFNATGKNRRKIQLFCLFLALMVAFSRMYLLYHFLRDVTAGALLGLLVGIIIYLFQDRFYPNAAWMNRGWLDFFRKDPEVKDKVPPPA